MIRFSPNLSTLQTSLFRRRTAATLTARMNQAEQEVASGRFADVYKALGLRSGQSLNLRATIDRTDGFIAANTQLQNRLDTMADTLGAVRQAAQDVFAMAVPNRDLQSQTAMQLQMTARAALDGIVGKLNTSYAGMILFGGNDNAELPLQTWTGADAATGLSPADVMDTIVGGGFANAADAAAKAAEVSAAFSNAAANPDHDFDATFYNGAAASAPHLTAQIDEVSRIDYGVQANDPALRDIIQGLSMLATIDVSQIPDLDAYKAWMAVAVDKLSAGTSAAIDIESRLGTQQQRLESVIDQQKSRQDIYKSQVLALEGVDAYDAASRVSFLEGQLNASYAVTSRLSTLTFLNFMR